MLEFQSLGLNYINYETKISLTFSLQCETLYFPPFISSIQYENFNIGIRNYTFGNNFFFF